MQLDFEMIKAITSGTVDVVRYDDEIGFQRFTPEQTAMYKKKRADFYQKSKASSGVKLRFRTDSKTLYVKIRVEYAEIRKYFALEVFTDGKRIGSIDNFFQRELPQYYAQVDGELGEFSKSFDLGDGIKTVTVFLPWNMKTLLKSFCLDDGAFVEPVKYAKKFLAFGDSITQGYDALWPSHRYISRLAETLQAEEICKAIGGERFCPDLAELKDDFVPDYISVAYGTNNWSATTKQEFDEHVEAFFENLYKNYPGVKTFVLTPIWRPNYKMKTDFESFFDVEKGIRQAVAEKENMIVIPGFDLLPHDETLFADQVLHPNDNGFDHYFRNLLQQVEKYI